MRPRQFARRVVAVSGAALLCESGAARAQVSNPAAAVSAAMSAAESALQSGERQIAESHFRSALFEGWMLTGAIAATEGRLPDARHAFTRAAAATADSRAADEALATVQVQMGEAAAALPILSRLAAMDPKNRRLRHLLAQAYVADGHPEAAVQELEEAHAAAPDDLETVFALASGYARIKKLDQAEVLFARIVAARPIPQTYVLIGRAYRDAAAYNRATAALRRALDMDPRVRRAHYYLGMVALMAEGAVRIEDAIREFLAEQKEIAPDDMLNNIRLGMAFVVARREREALAPLEVAARAPQPSLEAVEYLGRAQLGAGRPADAAATLHRALKMAEAASAPPGRLGQIHYVLATALRDAGRAPEAAAEFELAQRASAARTATDRERLDRYLTEGGEAPGTTLGAVPLAAAVLDGATSAQRAALVRQVAGLLARTCLNLGVLQAQAQRFQRAAAFFEQAAALEPAMPRVQYSLGVAYFNAKEHARAIPPLERALEAEPGNTEARRMLALAAFSAGQYARAADLLAVDPQRASEPSLEYTYGTALVRSDRGAEAERVFSRLLATHGDAPDLNVVLGQAHAQQGDFDAAVKVLRHALELKPDVADANATLGVIYLKQGRLDEAARALRAELAAHATDTTSRYTLATVLDLNGQQDEALGELRALLRTQPDHANARYLLGKILLARGDADAALAHLEIGVRLAPEDANIHYQLGLAYQKLGKAALAQQQFDEFQRLKDQRRKGSR